MKMSTVDGYSSRQTAGALNFYPVPQSSYSSFFQIRNPALKLMGVSKSKAYHCSASARYGCQYPPGSLCSIFCLLFRRAPYQIESMADNLPCADYQKTNHSVFPRNYRFFWFGWSSGGTSGSTILRHLALIKIVRKRISKHIMLPKDKA